MDRRGAMSSRPQLTPGGFSAVFRPSLLLASSLLDNRSWLFSFMSRHAGSGTVSIRSRRPCSDAESLVPEALPQVKLSAQRASCDPNNHPGTANAGTGLLPGQGSSLHPYALVVMMVRVVFRYVWLLVGCFAGVAGRMEPARVALLQEGDSHSPAGCRCLETKELER